MGTKKTIGRPRVENEKSVQVNLRFTEDEKAALDRAAEADDRSVSAWIRLLVIKALKEKKYL